MPKKPLRPLARTKIAINRTSYVNVCVWNDERGVRQAWYKGDRKAKKHENVFAFFGWLWTRSHDGKKIIGDIHLGAAYIGSGVVAHEIQHVILRWCQSAGWNFEDEKYQEPIAELAEKLTRRFWTWYWKPENKKIKLFS